VSEVAENACHCLQCKLQHHVPKKVELDSECLCFDEFPEDRFELAAKLQTHKLGNSQTGKLPGEL
jgi:hypothetical protein